MLLEEELGRPLTYREVAAATGLAPTTVLKYADRLGAVRVGRRALFFEKRVLEALKNGVPVEKKMAKRGGWAASRRPEE